jgi:hypothetical protein
MWHGDCRAGDLKYIPWGSRVDSQQSNKYSTVKDATWGKWLFRGVMALSLVFMWWLVIYSHGVEPH